MAQAPLQSPFYYYNPESEKTRQQQLHHQGHFYPMPQQHHNDYFSQPYSRPQSSHAAQMLYHPQPQYISQAMLTPAASPSRDMHQRPTILVQQEIPFHMSLDAEYGDYRFGPATPTLSSTSSISADSPQSAYPMLPTPGNDMYLSSFEGIKQGCEEEMFSEVLNGGDWAKSGSPSMSPGKLHFPHYISTNRETPRLCSIRVCGVKNNS